MKSFTTATLFLILPTLLFATPVPVNMGVPFELAPGQSAELLDGDLYLVFTGILSESRCPLGAICVWEGDAEAAVVGDLPGEIQFNCILHTSTMFAQSCDMDPYKVFLLRVDPYPVLDAPPIDPMDYRATLIIVEAGPVDVEKKAWGSIKALYR